MKRSIVIFGLIGLVVLVFLWLLSSYNGLISAKEQVTADWAQVETQYQRRADLIPNLVQTVSGAAEFEQETFTAVTAARSQWQQARQSGDLEQQVAATQQFDSALSRLLVTVEAYPQLQATQAFRDLMTQLEGTENRISVARRDYNITVRDYNIRVKRFPTVVLANFFGFDPAPFYEATDEGAEDAPNVEF